MNNFKIKTTNFIFALSKLVFKAGLVITGVGTYSLGWIDTPYGSAPIVQIFGTLNIIAACAWEYQSHKITTRKK